MSAKTIIEIYHDAKLDALVKAAYYGGASSKQFEERMFELSDLNARRADRWYKWAVQMQEAIDGLRGDWVPW
jgi:hypothetical protein